MTHSREVLFFLSASYDRISHILTVQLGAPSRTSWAAYEYRDVSPELYRRLLSGRPHAQLVLDEEIAPSHQVRRVGQHTWLEPSACPVRNTRRLVIQR